MMYQCESCHAIFTEPYTYMERENLDGENGWYYAERAVCPYCGEEWFEEVEDDAESG